MRENKVTLQTIANQLGISKVTVFKALNNQPGVSVALQQKIVELAAHVGYLRTYEKTERGPSNFAFLTPRRFFSEQEMFYTNIYYQINKRCMADANPLGLFIMESAEEKTGILPAKLNTGSYNGIFIGGEMSESFLQSLAKLQVPLVLIDYFTSIIRADMILIDNYISSYLITQYLIERGHKRIGFVGRKTDTHNIADRYFGYRKALLFAGLEFREDWNVVNYDPNNHLYTLDFAMPSDMPTAFVCHCDNAAYFMIQKLNMMGLSVPDEVSLVAFDNTALAKITRPALTTIENSREALANRAYDTMLKRLAHRDAHAYRVMLNSTIIERDSVKNLAEE